MLINGLTNLDSKPFTNIVVLDIDHSHLFESVAVPGAGGAVLCWLVALCAYEQFFRVP